MARCSVRPTISNSSTLLYCFVCLNTKLWKDSTGSHDQNSSFDPLVFPCLGNLSGQKRLQLLNHLGRDRHRSERLVGIHMTANARHLARSNLAAFMREVELKRQAFFAELHETHADFENLLATGGRFEIAGSRDTRESQRLIVARAKAHAERTKEFMLGRGHVPIECRKVHNAGHIRIVEFD